MKMLFTTAVIFFTAISFAAPLALAQAQSSPPAALITEIQIEGDQTTDEFVEIYNPGPDAISLRGWRLSKKTATGNEQNLLTEFPDIVLQSKSFLVVSNPKSAIEGLRFSTQQSLAYNNTAILYSDTGKTVVDLVGWGTASQSLGLAAENPDTGVTLQRKYSDGSFLNTGDNGNDFTSGQGTPGMATSSRPSPPEVEDPTPDQPAPDATKITSPAGPAEQQATPVEPTSGLAQQPAATGGGSYFPPAALNQEKKKPQIIINEVLANPAGTDYGEFIELKSLDSVMYDLSFWKIETDKAVFMFEPETFKQPYIYPGQLLVLKRADLNISLDNKKERIKLLDNQGKTIADVKLDGILEGASYIHDLTTGYWRWSGSPTPGLENVYRRPLHGPLADFDIKSDGQNVVLDASDSFDQDGDKLGFEWHIKPPGKDSSPFKRIGDLVKLALERPGKYIFRLKVNDPGGLVDRFEQPWTAKDEMFEWDFGGDGKVKASLAPPGVAKKVEIKDAKNEPETLNAEKPQAQQNKKVVKSPAGKKPATSAKTSPWILPGTYAVLALIITIYWWTQKRKK